MLASRQDAALVLEYAATRLGLSNPAAAPVPGLGMKTNAVGVAALEQKVLLLNEQNAILIEKLSVTRECLNNTRDELEATTRQLQSRVPQSAQTTCMDGGQVLVSKQEPRFPNALLESQSSFQNCSTSAMPHGGPMFYGALGVDESKPMLLRRATFRYVMDLNLDSPESRP